MIRCLLLSILLLPACAHRVIQDSAPARPAVDPWSIPEPVPRIEQRSRYGNPERYEVAGQSYRVRASSEGYRERGRASWYGTKFHGRRTSSGEPYDMYGLTAAHRSLPLPTYVRVTNLENGRSLIVRVNDRGPFHPNRILDLSYSAAIRLGVYERGSAPVEVVALTSPSAAPENPNVANTGPRAAHTTARQGADRGPYFLQLGAFRNMDNKNALVTELRQRGWTDLVERETTDTQGWTLHRVLVGPYPRLTTAQAQEARLNQAGYQTILVPE